MANGYTEITPNGYSYAILRVGVAMKNPKGEDVYFQPGDDTAAILETIEALEEIEDLQKRNNLAEITLGDYFAK